MFGLSIVDHVRLSLTQAQDNYAVHARAAERLARLTSRIRIIVLGLTLIAAASSVLSLIEPGQPYKIAAAVAAGLAFAVYAAYVGVGFEGRVNTHRACAHNLWMVCERHRALLTEIKDGLLDRPAILRRRDELALETHRAYAQTFPLDQPAYESLRQTLAPEERPVPGDARTEDDPIVGPRGPTRHAGGVEAGTAPH